MRNSGTDQADLYFPKVLQIPQPQTDLCGYLMFQIRGADEVAPLRKVFSAHYHFVEIGGRGDPVPAGAGENDGSPVPDTKAGCSDRFISLVEVHVHRAGPSDQEVEGFGDLESIEPVKKLDPLSKNGVGMAADDSADITLLIEGRVDQEVRPAIFPDSSISLRIGLSRMRPT